MWWLLALLLMAGYANLTTIGINRWLSIPQSKSTMSLAKLVQFSLIMMCLAYCVTQIGSARFLGAFAGWRSTTLDGVEILFLASGVIGFLLLVYSVIAHQLYQPPACEIEHDARVIDFRIQSEHQPWHQTLVGQGPMRWAALLPGNEQFSLEVNRKSYQLPRLPPQWDGLSIVHITDTHFHGAVSRRYFELVCEQAAALKPDLYAFTGDLLDDEARLNWLPETLGRLQAPLGQVFILGNHDWYVDASRIRAEFVRLGWTDIAGRSLALTPRMPGPPIAIAGDESPWMGHHPAFPVESRDQLRILISHTPDNISWARKQGVDLMLAGHTHGGQIQLPLLGPVYSPSRFGCRYASGVFWLNPTLLYVSRGISGGEPIRYLCRPELTKLVLRSNLKAD